MLHFRIVIPARFASQRLPGKPLLNIAGKPLIEHVYSMAQTYQAEQLIVATESKEIFECVQGFGGLCFMTSSEHKSGSDRIAEVVDALAWSDDTIVVNLQSDELMVAAENIHLLVEYLDAHDAQVATLVKPLAPENNNNPNVVKVVRDLNHFALYFSRLAVPCEHSEKLDAAAPLHLHHLGIYAYTCKYLKHFTQLPPTPLECAESLEQLRILEHGDKIYAGDAAPNCHNIGIDTLEDLHQAKKLLE